MSEAATPASTARPRADAPILVSACLAGVPCRYDARAKPDPALVDAARQGRAVPGELAVVSFDASIFSEMAVPRLTSLEQDKEEIGRLAAAKLLGLIRGEPQTAQVLPWALKAGESG